MAAFPVVELTVGGVKVTARDGALSVRFGDYDKGGADPDRRGVVSVWLELREFDLDGAAARDFAKALRVVLDLVEKGGGR